MLDTAQHILHILYLNIEGLTPVKYQQLIPLLDNRTYDLIVTSESWLPKFCNQPLPHLLISSRAYIDARGHHPGGLTALCRPTDRTLFTCTVLAEAIHIIWKNTPLLFAYVPYSIATEDLHRLIETWPPSQSVAADFNVDFGSMVVPPSLRGRAERILTYTNNNDLSLLTPTNSRARWDHLFSSANIVSQYSIIQKTDLPVKTNHPALDFTVVCSSIHEDESYEDSSDRHYVLSPLRTVKTAMYCRELFCKEYSLIQGDISRQISRLWVLAEQAGSDDDRQILADEMDSILLDAVQTVSDELLYLHDGSPRITRPPRFESTSAIVQTYLHINALNKTNTSRRIVSDDPALSPLQACVRTWSDVWNRKPTGPKRPEYVPTEDTRYKAKQIRKLIDSYPNDRASGMDGIHNLVLRALQKSSFPHHIASAYSLYKHLQLTLTRWNTGLTVMVPKDHTGLPAKCRPLTMIPVFRMHFERLLKQEYSQRMQATLHPAQAGFRPGDNTLRQILVAENIPDRRFRTLIDFRQAFDSPTLSVLMDSVLEFGPSFARLIFSLYCYATTSILSVNGKRSLPIRRTQGLFQGPPLPPELFSLIINALIRSFHARFSFGHAVLLSVMLVFADDIMILSRYLYEAYEMVKFIAEWSSPRGIEINYKKCVILSPGGESMIISSDDPSRKIEWKTHDKYLGVHITHENIDFNNFYEDIFNRFTRSFNWMKLVARTWSPAARLVIYRTFLQPILDYASPLFALHSLDLNKSSATVIAYSELWRNITELHNRAIAWILHQRTYTRILHSILGWEPICERFYSALLTFKHNNANNLHISPRLPQMLPLSQYYAETLTSTQSPLAWKQWLKRRRIDRHERAQHRGALITTRDANGMDLIMRYHVSKSLQIHLVYWRKGMFGWNTEKMCPHCKDSYSQRHIYTCFMHPDATVEQLIESEDWSEIEYWIDFWWISLGNTPITLQQYAD